MSVATKKKLVSRKTPSNKTNTSTIEAKAERYAEIQAKIKKVENQFKDESDALKAELVEWGNKNLKNDEDKKFATAHGKVAVGKRKAQMVLKDIEAAKKILGIKTFMKLVSIKVTDLRAYMTPDELEEVTEVDVTDTRTIKYTK